MKHPHPHTTSALEAAPLTQLAASQSRVRLASAFGAAIQRALRWALAVGRSGMDRLAAAAARAEQRVTEQFKVPPGGG